MSERDGESESERGEELHKKALNCIELFCSCEALEQLCLFCSQTDSLVAIISSGETTLRMSNVSNCHCACSAPLPLPRCSQSFSFALPLSLSLSSLSLSLCTTLEQQTSTLWLKSERENYKKQKESSTKLCYLKAQNATQCSSGQGVAVAEEVGRGGCRQSNCEQTN